VRDKALCQWLSVGCCDYNTLIEKKTLVWKLRIRLRLIKKLKFCGKRNTLEFPIRCMLSNLLSMAWRDSIDHFNYHQFLFHRGFSFQHWSSIALWKVTRLPSFCSTSFLKYTRVCVPLLEYFKFHANLSQIKVPLEFKCLISC
jgi:hypothetical protein